MRILWWLTTGLALVALALAGYAVYVITRPPDVLLGLSGPAPDATGAAATALGAAAASAAATLAIRIKRRRIACMGDPRRD